MTFSLKREETKTRWQRNYEIPYEQPYRKPVSPPEYIEFEDFGESEDIVDLRAFEVLGGVTHFDLLHLPPQPKTIKNWTITQSEMKTLYWRGRDIDRRKTVRGQQWSAMPLPCCAIVAFNYLMQGNNSKEDDVQ